jgi:hypothetical protein
MLNTFGSGTTSTGSSSSDTGGSSGDFGGSVGYLWHSVIGGEFLAGWTPNFEMNNTFVPSDPSPRVSTYMFNIIGAAPLGEEARFQPYVSGGWGAVTLHNASTTGTFTTGTGTSATATFMDDENRAGGNIGFGVLAFLGNWGVRGDIRYFKAFAGNTDTASSTTTSTTNSTTTTTGATGTTTTSSTSTTASGTGDNGEFELLPGLNFWRANIGLAIRW